MLNLIWLLVIALAGFAILFYVYQKRREKQPEALETEKEDPVTHIRNKLFFEIPVEKFLLGYFSFVALTYLVKLIAGARLPGIDLAVLYLSGITFFLGIYKMAMSVGVVNKFSPWLLFSIVFSLLIFVAAYEGIPVELTEFLVEVREYNLSIHLLGMIMGVGGTFIIDVMFSHFMKNYTFSASESVIMHLISQMIIFGLFLLILSGLALFIPFYETYLENSRFIMKMIVVFVVIINGAVLNLYITPKMENISLKEKDRGEYETLNRISFALGAVSIVSWLSAFLLAMLKSLFDKPLSWLLAGYVLLVILAISGSQLAKLYYQKKEENEPV